MQKGERLKSAEMTTNKCVYGKVTETNLVHRIIIPYTITCALNDQSCRCAIKQHSFIVHRNSENLGKK